ncbi:hypothetical protein N7512_000640 [Penicillium capsulatum]|nr:hypothetical protein N7512_000640 [Penicillium capsulatum]
MVLESGLLVCLLSSPSKRRHRHHHRPRQPSPHTIPDPHARPLSPTDAFRESLFDALGDDEGAAYWESVYGQPIHTYDIPAVPKGPDGILEQMSEEEYVAYVRARMWERTREGIAEEQERIRAERRRAKAAEDDAQRRDSDRRAFDAAMMDSLARGAERRQMKAWDGVWAKYVASWEEIGRVFAASASASASASIGDGEASADGSASLRNLLFWPVLTGKRRDVSPDAVREFLVRAPKSTDLLATLKIERVRWHPDKMQHRYGAQGIEDAVMQSVTEVFQIVDRMWTEERERKR